MTAAKKKAIRVLCVDDQALVGEAVRRILESQEDSTFLFCDDSSAAVDAAIAYRPTVILQDLEMPNLSGFDLLQRYRDCTEIQDVPVLMLTGREEPKSKAQAFALGASDYIVKLPSPVELIARVRHHSASYTNMTQRRRSEEALREAELAARQAASEAREANRAKSSFLAKMSHEIRTPMNAILGYAQILAADERIDQDQRKAVETIAQSGEHLLGLINDVLDISKIEAGREELTACDFDLTGLVQSLGAMFELRCQQKGLEWKLQEAAVTSTVHGDEKKLRQILINLLGNAVKFTTQGSITLSVDTSGEDRYRFEVVDTGPGIAADNRATIFEPFHQDQAGIRHGGSGLGLAIARSHVELMGGSIELETEIGAGARFSFELHLPSAEPLAREDARRWNRVTGLANGHSACALVVDDVATNRDVLEQMLRRVGVDVVSVASGEQALEWATQQRPDIVFLDLHLPGIDGEETRRRLLTQFGEGAPKIVCITAAVFNLEGDPLGDKGFDHIILKPVRGEELYSCLAELAGLEFEYRDVPAEPPAGGGGASSWEGIVLPPALARELVAAAESQSISDLNKQIDGLAALGGSASAALGAHLRGLSRSFDMTAIRNLLEQLEENTDRRSPLETRNG